MASFSVHFKTPTNDPDRREPGTRIVSEETPDKARQKVLKELPSGSIVTKVKVVRQ